MYLNVKSHSGYIWFYNLSLPPSTLQVGGLVFCSIYIFFSLSVTATNSSSYKKWCYTFSSTFIKSTGLTFCSSFIYSGRLHCSFVFLLSMSHSELVIFANFLCVSAGGKGSWWQYRRDWGYQLEDSGAWSGKYDNGWLCRLFPRQHF